MPFGNDLRLGVNTGIGGAGAIQAGAEVIAAGRFAEVTARGKVVVEFFNYGCPYCQAARAEVHKAANAMADKGVKFYMISLGDAAGQELGGQYAPGYLPGFAVFENGRHVGSFNRVGNDDVKFPYVRDSVKRLLAIS